MKKIPLFALAAFAFTLSAVHSLEVNRDELSSTTDTVVDFINYTGPHDVINTIEQIRGIGSRLGVQIRQMPADEAARVGDARYRVIHAVDPTETVGFDADIFILGPTAAVDHIDNLRRILSGYLSSAYGYTARDGDTLAFFITVYNAVHRGDMGFFQSKYKNVVTRELSPSNAGLARNYSDWAGQTQIVIPLSDPMFSGTLSTIDTTALVESDVIQSIREDDGSPRGIRTEMTELREREGDEAQDRADQARADAAAARDEAARLAREGDAAQASAEQARDEAAAASEEAARLAQEGDEAQARAEQARDEAAAASEEAARLARETEEAQRAAETARQEADEAATLADLNPDDEEAQRAAEEAAAVAEERAREAERLAAESEAARAQAQESAATAEQQERDAERLAAESEAALAQAQESAAEAEAREREAAALREQEEEAARRAAEAESRAEREQQLADARQEEAAQERLEIAADTQEDLDRESARRAAEAERERELAEARRQEEEAAQRAAEAEAERELAEARRQEEEAEARRREDAAIAAGNAGAVLRVVNPNSLLSEVILVNTESGSPMRTSALNNIRNRTLVDTGDAYMAVAGQGPAVRLVLIDKLTLDVTKESDDAIATETVLVASGSDYYAVVARGGAFYVARFDKDLNVQSTSDVQVQPYTAIMVSDGRLLVQDTDSRIRVLRAADLTDMAE